MQSIQTNKINQNIQTKKFKLIKAIIMNINANDY